MNKRNWLNATEYLLLIGSGLGSLASVASQQILFTAAPVSALLLLNVVNRQRGNSQLRELTTDTIALVDRKLTSELQMLQHQVQGLPTYLDLASLRKAIQNHYDRPLSELQQAIEEMGAELQEKEWQTLCPDIEALQNQHAELAQALQKVTTSLAQLNPRDRLAGLDSDVGRLREDLAHLRTLMQQNNDEQRQNQLRNFQEQIDQLNRRFNKLPPQFDATSLRQDIASLIKVVGELAPRRELSRLEGQLEKLAQQNSSMEQAIAPVKLATTILHKQVETLATRLNSETLGKRVHDLEMAIAQLDNQVTQLPLASELQTVRNELHNLVSNNLEPLQRQMLALQSLSQTIDHRQKAMHEWVNHLPEVLDTTALQRQVHSLKERVEWSETLVADLQTHVDITINNRLESLQQGQPTSQPETTLVFDLQAGANGSTGCSCPSLLAQALDTARTRLVVTFPYPTPETLNEAMLNRFYQFLDQGGHLDLGWGHLGMVVDRSPRSLDRRHALEPAIKDFLHSMLQHLTQFKRQFPDQFHFKVLGTNENFLVCDRTVAILGAQSIPTASAVFPQAAVGLRTTNSDVIDHLLTRFDSPILESHDAESFFNRAMTRYDLGDRVGAIADFTEVLRINPTDDVAYNNRGLAHYDLGDRRAALVDFEQAMHYNPHNVIACCNRGYLRGELDDELGAIEDYTHAIQLYPDCTTAYFYRAQARNRLQNKLGAIEDYTEVLRLNPQDASAHFYRGLACIKVGHRLEAIRDLRQAANLFKQQGDTINYKQTVQALRKLQKTLVIAGSAQATAKAAIATDTYESASS